MSKQTFCSRKLNKMDIASQEFNLKLIQAIEKRPCLYNYKLPEYMSRWALDKAWKEVAQEVGVSDIWLCKTRWKNLRAVYTRTLKKIFSGRTSKPYYLTKAMEFALPFIRPSYLVETNEYENILDEENVEEMEYEIDIKDGSIVVNSDDEIVVFEENSNDAQSTSNMENVQSTVKCEVEDKNTEEESNYRKTDVGNVSPEQSSDVECGMSVQEKEDTKLDNENDRQTKVQKYRQVECTEQEKCEKEIVSNIEVQTSTQDNNDSTTPEQMESRKMFLLSLLPDLNSMTNSQMRQFKIKVSNLMIELLDNK